MQFGRGGGPGLGEKFDSRGKDNKLALLGLAASILEPKENAQVAVISRFPSSTSVGLDRLEQLSGANSPIVSARTMRRYRLVPPKSGGGKKRANKARI